MCMWLNKFDSHTWELVGIYERFIAVLSVLDFIVEDRDLMVEEICHVFVHVGRLQCNMIETLTPCTEEAVYS